MGVALWENNSVDYRKWSFRFFKHSQVGERMSLSEKYCHLFRVNVEIARGTPHGRDRERWGSGGGGGGRRERSPYRGGDRSGRRDSRDGRRPVWLDKYGPPTRTEYRLTVENLSSRVSWQVG